MARSHVIFLELVNLEVKLDERLVDLIAARQDEREFGHEKLTGLVVGIKILSLASARLSGCAVGPNSDWLAATIREIASIVGFDDIAVTFAEWPSTRTDDSTAFNFIVDSGCDELGDIVLVRDYLSRAAPEAVFFASRFEAEFRHDASLSVRARQGRLREIGFGPVILSYFAMFLKGIPVNAVPCERRLSPENQRRCLFVVGHARSASSLLFSMLNEVPDILLSYEANLDIVKNRHSLVDNYNRLQRNNGRPLSKGFYFPTYLAARGGIADVFETLLSHYALVGDKMAHGAREAMYEIHPAKRAFEFLMEWFPFARFIITLRAPGPAIAAMARLHPELSVTMLIDFWLGGVLQMINLLMVSETAAICLYERVLGGDIQAAEAIAGRDLRAMLELVRIGSVTTSADEIYAFWGGQDAAFRSLLGRLSHLYDDLTDLIDPATGRYGGPGGRSKLWDVRDVLNAEYATFLKEQT